MVVISILLLGKYGVNYLEIIPPIILVKNNNKKMNYNKKY